MHQIIDPATGNVVADCALATPADVDAAVASARAALPGWSTATPAERSAVLAKLAQLAGRARRGAGGRRGQSDRQAGAARYRVRRSGQRRQHRLLRGSGAASRGQGHRRVLGRPHVEHPARGHRRGRDHHAVELPAADGGVEGHSRIGRRLLGGDQARRGDAADDADAGPARQRGGAARRRAQRRHRRRGRRRHRTGRPPRRRPGDVHRLNGRRTQGDVGRGAARPPHPTRTRRQGAVPGVRRRRPGRRHPWRGRRVADQHRPGLHRRDAGHRRARPVRRLRGGRRRADEQGRRRRPARSRHRPGPVDHPRAPGEGRGHGRPRRPARAAASSPAAPPPTCRVRSIGRP